jgi:hypothetical protein
MERLRAELLGRERVKTGELADRVLADLDADAPLDVMRHARELGMDAPPFMPDGRPAVRTADLVETGARPFWGGLTADAVAPLAERFWRETLAALPPIEAQGGRTVVIRGGSGGWGKIRGKALDADKLKLLPYIDRILAEAEWVFTENARRAVHAENGVVLHDLLAAVEYDGRMLEVRLKVREDQNGKFFYDFFNESEGIPRGKKDAPPDARSDADAGGTRGGADSEQWGLRAASRREASPADTPNRDSSMPDAAGEVNSGYSPLERETVNLEVRDVTPDWTPQPAQRRGDAPLAEEGLAQEAARERALAFEAERLAQEGRITPEERAAFEETDAALGEIERESEAALAVLSCITGA